MRIGIMQPYWWPYLGYYQLIKAVDAFVVYDDIKYTKKGWINRNRILLNDAPHTITLPLAADADDREIRARRLAANFSAERGRLERRIAAAYRRAPYFAETMPLVTECLDCTESNLFGFLLNSLRVVLRHLEITTPVHVSSTLGVSGELHGEERVVATCQALRATDYVNPPGGRALYNPSRFRTAGLRLHFIEPRLLPYTQLGGPFVSHLSIIDVMMFNSRPRLAELLQSYTIEPAT